ncbi:MAG TPA: biotin--[acetyl-CoA-carboxylase] ligase [Terrimesophilobacter sp.]|uniref:biotin--[acetyl-CoA-carboxylase] ligase n=1 Tax=Terrimesophilobacter sp. TaxID=2906435 RepID=UPI002F94000B
MDFPASRAAAREFVSLAEVGSTNDELRDSAVAGNLPDFSVVVTLNQTAGRGRLDRVWVAPPGQALAVSVLLRPTLPGGGSVAIDRYGWIPLLAGLAMTRAVQALVHTRSLRDRAEQDATRSLRHRAEQDATRSLSAALRSAQRVSKGRSRSDRLEGGPRVSLKWPNDVLIDGRKVSGLLAELLPDAAGVIVGAGLNLSIPEAELPVPTATSLSLNGVAATEELADQSLAAYLVELRSLWSGFLAAGGDAEACGIRSAVSEACSTLGQPVRVSLPGGTELLGTAVDLDAEGRLRIRSATDAPLQTVAAGDITHLRYE